ncbi:hypothetical protein FO440_21785 [Mucilaginibacter corticis]|uniref:Uncharacterized protein n=1 Tax=Mucilaginibacter corticis TaxID=2597670 RepID=A0A556M960_9SPHI|nr:hypothetical protein [Mucilaginibacter corticis]TSJ36467.1 hypothetical protein FO440_21785 [Mucilaginibacter corticis]
MSAFVLIIEILFSVAAFLLIIVTILAGLKSLKKDHFPNWKFLDYFSVGYVEYLFAKFFKKDSK